MNDEYDFCGLKRGECNYQINADKKIATLEKALELACEMIVECMETCPYELLDCRLWCCDDCKDEFSKCWNTYFVLDAGEQYDT